MPTRMRSKAEGVPPRWTWPRIVTLVSYPRRFTTSCGDTGDLWDWPQKGGSKGGCPSCPPVPSVLTYGLDVIRGDGLAVLVDGALGHDDDVEPGAAITGLGGT